MATACKHDQIEIGDKIWNSKRHQNWMLRPFVKRVVDRRDKVADNVYAEVVDIYEGCLVQNCVRGKQILAEKSAESFRLLGPWSRR